MKLIFFLFISCFYLFSNDTFNHFIWYQSIEINHSTTFRKDIFKDNFLQNDDKLSNEFADRHLILVSYNYINKFSYRYFFSSILLNYIHGEDQFFDNNIKLDNKTIIYNQYTLIPELFFKWKFFAIGFGYYINFNMEAPHRYTFLFNKNSPFFKIKLDQKLGKIPLHALLDFYLSPKKFTFNSSTIYSFSIGLRIDITYYINISGIFTKNYLEKDGIQDNIGRIQFIYRIFPYLSLGIGYSQLVYTENRNPYNEISVNISYLHDFNKE